MSESKISFPQWSIYTILGLIWLLSNLSDRLWLSLNQAVPAWDQSNHLTNSLLYLRALQTSDLGSGEWWRQLWMLSPKYPPITYLLSVPFQSLFGKGNDSALLTSFLCSGILIACVYTLGKILFNHQVGLWAAAITVLLPRLYQTRLQFLLDNPLLTFTIASFTFLTIWKQEKNLGRQWLWIAGFSLSLGIGLLTKQSILFYLFFPLLGLIIYYFWQRKWTRILQLLLSFLGSSLIWYPWYRTNWIYLFSTAQNSNAIPAAMEGDPAVNTLAAWVYYGKDLPLAVSWVLLIVPLVGLILDLLKRFPRSKENQTRSQVLASLGWLGLYFGGTYLICSALYNKDSRYIIPYLPILAIFLAYGLTRWRGRWQWVRWGAIAVAILVTITNLFPIPGSDQISQFFSPEVLFRPNFNQTPPHTEIFTTAQKLTPEQIINLGVIPNTDAVNPNTLNYFGTLANYQGFGRELGSNQEKVAEDYLGFDWFLTKTGENGYAQPPQLALAEKLSTYPDFQQVGSWPLADQSLLQLFHRQTPSVSIKSLAQNPSQIKLEKVILPEKTPPGQPVPITYQWSASRHLLERGLVLLTWRSRSNPQQYWLQDHRLGLGQFFVNSGQDQGLEIVEHTAMLPTDNLTDGIYQLEASYLNLETGQTQLIALPTTQITLDSTAPALPAPPLDFVTQLRQLALNLPKGVKGLDPVFQQVDRLNLYDPTQDYLKQVDASLSYRLAHDPKEAVNWTYAVVLARVLQQNPQTAIAALQSLVKLDSQNPYSHGYLAFVYLYDWQGKAAEKALQPALQLAPNNPYIQALKAISLIMQGNLWGGWQTLAPILTKK
jgi:4-amino-4-deoxy-L-arabinose transferase-like glycosyltransferase